MQVAIFFGSKSDTDTMKKAAAVLKDFGVTYEAFILSAHRSGELLDKTIKEVEQKGAEVIIAGAGLAAHLPGVIAAKTVLPVIGIPVSGSVLDGQDALYSIVQMPPGIPVATVAINGSKNAAWLALEIMSVKHPEVREMLLEERQKMQASAIKANEEVSSKYE